MKNIIVYSRNHCPYCDSAKQLLSSKGLTYTEINVDHSENRAVSVEEMLKLGKGKTFPQIIIDGAGIGGFTELLALLESDN